MQPRLLITLCIAPGQIMLFPPSRTLLKIDSAKNPSPLLTFYIWHFAAALMVEERLLLVFHSDYIIIMQ